MVIQRWQSVMLVLAVACMVVYIFMPSEISEINMPQGQYIVDPKNNLGLWLPAVVSAALYFIDIFLFKNFKAQLWTQSIPLSHGRSCSLWQRWCSAL